MRDDLGHRDPGADYDAVAARADVPEGGIGDAQDRIERLVAGVHRTHDDRAAGQQTRAALAEGALGLVEAGEAVDRDGHQDASRRVGSTPICARTASKPA